MITEEKEELDPVIKKFSERICRSVSYPMLIVDKLLCVVYTSHPKTFPVGMLLSVFMKDPLESPLKREKDIVLIHDDKTYCARFIPIEKGYSFCQLLDHSDVLAMAACTDLYSVMSERFTMLEECSENIREYTQKLADGLPPKAKLKNMRVLDILAETDKLEFLLNGITDYAYVAFSANNSNEIIDAKAMVGWIVKEANAALEESGKYMEFMSDENSYYICTNQRYAITAVLNAVQNALLYSPVDDVPIISLTKTDADGVRYNTVQVVNNIDVYNGKTEDKKLDFVTRRSGLGIPLIKKFVQKADGQFYFRTSGSKAFVGIMIPEYIPDENDKIKLETDGFNLFNFGHRDVISLMMLDVVSSVSKKKKRH